MKIYNSLSGSKQVFKPITQKKINMYVCGMTVYDNCHIGHARTFLTFDLFLRFFNFLGFEVNYVRNITDIEDKIIEKAKIEKVNYDDISSRFIESMHEDFKKLNLLSPNLEPKASEHIGEIVSMIENLESKNHAYSVEEGDVYFDINSYSDYGKLSKRNLEELDAGARVEVDKFKKSPNDFVLWKKTQTEPNWKSRWGRGRPGWHIECSAMSKKYLGNTFDIHGGGLDLKFPHHENEIAQSECCNEKGFANYWMHVAPLNVDGKKMSKSLDNSGFPNEIFNGSNKEFSKKFSPMTLKFFMYQAHYRNTLDISNHALLAAEKGFEKIKMLAGEISTINESKKNDFNASEWVDECYDALNDDFNSPKLIAKLFDLHKTVSEIKNRTKSIDLKNKKILIRFYKVFYSEILGLDDDKLTQEKFDEILELILELREKERLSKNYEKSDYIRDKLSELGVKINDKI